MKTVAVVLAAGCGSRAKTDLPKQFVDLSGKPVLAWSLAAFEACGEIDSIIVAASPEYFQFVEDIAESYNISKLRAMTEGGERRQDSSRNTLEAMDYNDDDILLFHDAARPMLSHRTISGCVRAVKKTGAAAAVVPSPDTVYLCCDGRLDQIPDRSSVYCAQTPQAFRFSIIRDAHTRALENNLSVTDDISLVHSLGIPVELVEGDSFAMKITGPDDFVKAEAVAGSAFPFPVI